MEKQLVDEHAALTQVQGDLEAMKENYEHRLKVMELESQGLTKHLKDKWRTEFDRRRKLHNAVSSGYYILCCCFIHEHDICTFETWKELWE